MKHIAKTLWILVCFALGTMVCFHPSVLSLGRVLMGDAFDARLILHLQEHWFRVFSGQTSWLDVGMFYPLENTLGFSDTFFLFGVGHSLWRMLGLGLYDANLANYLTLAAIGFSGFYCFLRREMDVRGVLAAPGAGLFIAFGPIVCGPFLAHPQILGVWFLPWVLVLGMNALRQAPSDRRKACLSGAGAALLLALITFSTFYTGWFFILYLGISILAGLAPRLLRPFLRRSASTTLKDRLHAAGTAADWGWLRPLGWPLTVAAGAFLLGLVPFAITYLPVLSAEGGRSFYWVWDQLPAPGSYLNPSVYNALWGWLPEMLMGSAEARRAETYFGLPLLSALVFASAVTFRLRSRSTPSTPSALTARDFLPAALGGLFICWVLLVRIGDFSLWRIVYSAVPGASAIRAPFRLNSVLAITMLAVIFVAFEQLARSLERHPSRLRRGLAALLPFAGLLLIAEQWLVFPPNYVPLDQAVIGARLDAIPPPPVGLETFVATPPPGTGAGTRLQTQLDASAIAQRSDLPTMNGFSGILPKGHKLYTLDGNETPSAYANHARAWVEYHGIQGPVGVLHLASASWESLDAYLARAALAPFYRLTEPLSAGTASAANAKAKLAPYALEGWSMPEPEFTWTDGPVARVAMRIERPAPGFDLVLKLTGSAYRAPKHRKQRFRFLINGTPIATREWPENPSPAVAFLVFSPNLVGADGLIQLQIECPDAISPAALGRSGDSRNLALALHELEIFPQPTP